MDWPRLNLLWASRLHKPNIPAAELHQAGNNKLPGGLNSRKIEPNFLQKGGQEPWIG